MSTTTTLTNREIFRLARTGRVEELSNQPLYYEASDKVSEIRRMIREKVEDIEDQRESLYRGHAEGEVVEQRGEEQFQPETETVVQGSQEAEIVQFKSDEDQEKFQEKWNSVMDGEVEGFPVIKERSLEKVKDDLRIRPNVLDDLRDLDLIQENPDEDEEE